MHESDRSHPRLVALDRLARDLTYHGWEFDVKGVEEKHIGLRLNDYSSDRCGVSDEFKAHLNGIARKQHTHETGVDDLSTLHPKQRDILATKWTYEGWQEDIAKVRFGTNARLFERELERCQLKQMMHDNDFSTSGSRKAQCHQA
jgi:hypothetical protein